MDQAIPRGPGGPSGSAPRKKKKKFSILGFIGKIFLVLFTLCVIGVLTLGMFAKLFMTYINTNLIPSLGEITIEEMTMSLASTIYYEDANGQQQVLRTLHTSESNRELIKYSDLPDCLVKAMVAIEDHRFWEHKGVDWYGTARAMLSSATGGNTQGGSTITQQLVRNMTGDTEVTVKRKFREICRALDFDAKNSKEDILTLYLNYVYFGHGFSGIQTAAKGYFGKDVSELDLAESACIVGITNYPSLYDPLWDTEFVQDDGTVKTPRDFNKQRQETVLNRMLELGWISEAECSAAKAEKLLFVDTPEYAALHGLEIGENEEGEEEVLPASRVYSWYEDQVIEDAIAQIQEAKGVNREMATDLLYSAGYHIYTALDMDIQNIVDEVYENPDNFNYPSKSGASLDSAITVLDPYTGDVVAMAGGVGQKTTNRALNLATSRRTCGSAIKPVSVYAPAIDADVITPASIIDDYPIRVNDAGTGGYPKNASAGFRGPISVQYAVQQSHNTVAARVLQMLGTTKSFYFMEDNLGFDLDERDNAISPLSMGGLTYGVTTQEMAAAFAAFANKGIYTPPRTITRIESNDHSEVIVDNSGESRVAMKETTAYLMNKLLRRVVTSGTGTGANFDGMTIAGKTGTTDDLFDRYFCGYTPYYSAAVWVGYAGKSEKINAGGKNPAALAWKKVMEKIHEGLEDKSFPGRPESGITTVSVCMDCGLLAGDLCSSDYRGSRVAGSIEMQSSGVPKAKCTCHTEVRVCTTVDPETGEEVVRLAGAYCPEDTVSTRVMLQGREFLELPGGGIIGSSDMEAHLTYLKTLGECPVHDENFVPEPQLPEGEPNDPNAPEGGTGITLPPGTTPVPGGPGWPTEPWDPGSVNKPDTPSTNTPEDPDGEAPKPPDGEGGGDTTTPDEPEEPKDGASPSTEEPEEPDEPSLPDEPKPPEER